MELRPIQEITTISTDGTYSNQGDYVFRISSEGSTVTIRGNEEERYFGVIAHNTHFTEWELLVNTTNYYEGTVFVGDGMRIFEVTAVGDWEFEF